MKKYVDPKFNATSLRQHYAGELLNKHYNKTGENLLGSGLKICRRVKFPESATPHTAFISVTHQPNGTFTSDMYDVAHCGNAHLCSYCSAIKCKHLRDWLKEIHIPSVLASGRVNGLLTLTAHHHRRSNWVTHTNKFFMALTLFRKTMRKYFELIGCDGRIQATEYPVGENGMQLHIHDLFPYLEGADLDALKAIILEKWKAALKTQGLWCSNKHGVNIKKHGTFDPFYIANEMSAHDTKSDDNGNEDDDDKHEAGLNLFKLLDKYSKGDKHAGEDWLRVAKAMQGRDRFNVGLLAHKLGNPSPSEWRRPKGKAQTEPSHLIEYPQSHHFTATSQANGRPGLAMILRAARQKLDGTRKVHTIVKRLCDETISCTVATIKAKHAYKLADVLSTTKEMEKPRVIAKYYSHCTFAIADYTAKTQLYLYKTPATPSVIPSINTTGLHVKPRKDLVFM